MQYGIVGAGEIGGAFAARLVDAGHQVVVANSRGPETLASLVERLGPLARAATVAEAATAGEIVVVAVPFFRHRELPPEPFAGRIVVDTNNYDIYRDPRDPRLDRGETTSGQLLAAHLPQARIVKAFNTMWYQRILREGRPGSPLSDRLAVPIAGDDPAAKEAVARLAEELGFAPVDNGTLADSRRQEYGTPVFNKPVGPAEVAALLQLT
jgi:predicted dinucleotide-binding enzyme